MSRSTQFIGLTQEAEEYVKNLEQLESDSNAVGLFEEIPLRKWKLPEEDFKCIKNKENIFLREVVQECLWSSGPMIFTCLEVSYENGEPAKFLQWINDPRVRNQEYDIKQGKFWV